MLRSMRRAVLASRCFTSRQVNAGTASRRIATTPLALGAAEDVPLNRLV